jgi:hypothetical protein
MRAYRRHAIFVSLLLAGYLLCGSVFRFTQPSGEVFPIFSFTLFMRVPNTVTEYGVEVLQVRGQPLSPPRAFHAAPELFPGAGDVRASRVVHRMGRALEKGEQARLADLRRLFEDRYLGSAQAPARYRLVRHVYSPLERWRTGEVRQSAALGAFEVAGEAP